MFRRCSVWFQQEIQSFWSHRAVNTSLQEIKGRHTSDRALDKQLRWGVRSNFQDNGATSNLYPIQLGKDSPAIVYRYELSVTRKLNAATAHAAGTPPSRIFGTISPVRAWSVFQEALKRYPSLPPMIQVQSRIYSTEMIPAHLLELPREFLDLGWDNCRLIPVDKVDLRMLAPNEVRQVINKMLPWALKKHSVHEGTYSMVRDVDGKMVCTDDGISVAGLRIFKGTIAQTLHVSPNADGNFVEDTGVPASRALCNFIPQTEVVETFEVRCMKLYKEFIYKGQMVQCYFVADSSGTIMLSLWGYDSGAMRVGTHYQLSHIRVTKTNARLQRGEFGHELHAVKGSASITEVEGAGGMQDSLSIVNSERGPRLVLRIDTRSTVASERNLLQEVVTHFGAGPYDDEKERRIQRAVTGTPVVVATNLKHQVVKGVRFDVRSINDAPVDMSIREFANKFDQRQPYAVMNDYSVLPLQFLHCCFDPKMRSWQDITVTACSYLPQRRALVLAKFRSALVFGLEQWNVSLLADPLVSKSVGTLKEPQQMRGSQILNTQSMLIPDASPRPKCFAVVSIVHEREHTEDKAKLVSTGKAMSKAFRTSFYCEAPREDHALAYLTKTLMNADGSKLKEQECVVLIICTQRETKPMRWLYAECMKRGMMPVLVRAVGTEKRQNLLVGNLTLLITRKFALDPLLTINLHKEVPILQHKAILVVGIDAVHTNDVTTGASVGLLITPKGSCWIPTFWRTTVRGQEIEEVAQSFGQVVNRARQYYPGIEEYVVLQDGNVFSELDSLKAHIPSEAGFSLMCLHKRTHIRFVHKDQKGASNAAKGTVVQDLTPVAVGYKPVAPSFYLQAHESDLSTTRTVHFTIHHLGEVLDVPTLQALCNGLASAHTIRTSKAPLPTRAANILCLLAECLIDACPDFRSDAIPSPLSKRSWFL